MGNIGSYSALVGRAMLNKSSVQFSADCRAVFPPHSLAKLRVMTVMVTSFKRT